MAIDLGTLRETVKGHKKELLTKKSQSEPSDEEILNLMTSHQITFPTQTTKNRVGRPNKQKNQFLNKRITLLMTVEQKEILNKRRGANTLGEVDASSFIREWLIRTKCFDIQSFPIGEFPLANLPE
jgi:hypothetical protein